MNEREEMRNAVAYEEDVVDDGPIPITIRLFKNKFSWQWEHFVDSRYVISRIFQYTREQLGYNGDSKMPEVEFQNVRHKKWDRILNKEVWKGTGEWYLDTQKLQEVHGITAERANELLSQAFQTACTMVGGEEGITFDFTIEEVNLA